MKKVLFSYYFSKPDPQRGVYWPDDFDKLKPLIESLTVKKIPFALFHDGLTMPRIRGGKAREYVKINPEQINFVGSVARRFHHLEYLKANEDITHVWMVDSTDVECLKNPWSVIEKGILYVGKEAENTLNCPWMRKTQVPYFTAPDYYQAIEGRENDLLTNAGLIGGDRETVIEFLELYCATAELFAARDRCQDMVIFNYVLYKHFRKRFEAGMHINTRFKAYEVNNDMAIWRHK